VHGAFVLASQPLPVVDFSGQLASGPLTALARRHAVPVAVHPLPSAPGVSGIVAGLTAAQFASALAEAIHAGTPSGTSRADRAVDVRVTGQLAAALGGDLDPARLAAAAQAALGQDIPPGLVSADEADLIAGDLFRDAYRTQISPVCSAWTRSYPTWPATPRPGRRSPSARPGAPAWRWNPARAAPARN
jgi:hypothetical protein